jgi:hypothetical protein
MLDCSFGMMLTTFVLRRYNNELQTSEVFSTAGRTVKSGLVSSAVVSSWTWAATLLQSSAVAYRYGVSGPFWYASGATVQVRILNRQFGLNTNVIVRSSYSQPWPSSSSEKHLMLTPSSKSSKPDMDPLRTESTSHLAS